MTYDFPAVATLSRHILRSDDSVAGDFLGVWDWTDCRGTPHCPPRYPRFIDKYKRRYFVRRGTTADNDRLVALYADRSPSTLLSYPPHRTEECIAEWLTTILDRGYNLVMIAEREPAIVGHVVIMPETAAEPELAVPEYRRQGIATELTKHAIVYATVSDYTGLYMEVSVANKPALDLATTLGFEGTENIEEKNRFDLVRFRHSLDGDGCPWIDAAQMET